LKLEGLVVEGTICVVVTVVFVFFIGLARGEVVLLLVITGGGVLRGAITEE
jgi:hypothetical protein